MGSTRVRGGWIGLAFLLVASAAPAKVQREKLLPEFDPSKLETAVAEQLSALRGHVEQALAADLNVAEAAELIGELGRHYHAYSLVEPAEHCFRTATELTPDDFRWHYHLAHLLQTTGRPQEAVTEYKAALEIVPEVAPALIRLGETYQALNLPLAAVEVLERALALDPTSSAAHAVLGDVYLSQRLHEKAIEELEKALDLEPGANLLFYPLALAYRGLGDEDKARELIAKRGKVGVRPADPLIDGMTALTTGERVHVLRGRSAFGAGRWAEAVDEFSKAVAAAPESVSALVNLGTAQAQNGDIEAAISTYQRAVELGPGNATGRFNLGVLLARLGRLEEAREELRASLLYAPEDSGAHWELAQVLVRLERHEEALLHLERAVAGAPTSEDIRLAQAQALIALERWQDAVAGLEDAHETLPNNEVIAFALARLLAASMDGAVRDGARAVELALGLHESNPSTSRAELVASSMAEAGRCAEAAEWQRRAIDAAGDGPQANRERMLRRRAHYEGADPCRPPVAPAPPQQP